MFQIIDVLGRNLAGAGQAGGKGVIDQVPVHSRSFAGAQGAEEQGKSLCVIQARPPAFDIKMFLTAHWVVSNMVVLKKK